MNSFTRISASLILALGATPIATQARTRPLTEPIQSQPAAPGGDRLTPSELEEILGSIALYPDPLLANVLAASVYPDEVAEAAKFVASGGKAEEIKGKSWEDSVKAVASIPDAIKMMGEYPDWVVALGQAYLLQAKDVMDVVQTLRKKAQANGALKSSPQQEVVVEQEVVYIKSPDPEVIYVPTYSPSVVYVDHHDDDWMAGTIGFGVGITAGLIIANNMDCHWGGGCVGWGWGGGGYGGHNDVDIDINGDVNIGNKNFEGGDRTREGGDRTTNREGGDRTTNSGNRTSSQNGGRVSSQNRTGNEGNAWSPNKSKPNANSKPSQANRMKQGGANTPATPGGGSRTGASNRAGGAGAGTANRAGGAGAGAANRGGSASAGNRAAGGAKPSQPAAKSRVPASRPPAASKSSKPSAYEGGRSTNSASQRGNSSRGSSASSRGSSGGSRSAPPRSGGGSGRSGGGGRGGGGGRR